jgi:hypothetical protein
LTGKFFDFPFEKKISFGFMPLIIDSQVSEKPLTDFGVFKNQMMGFEWPMTRCLQEETTESEVSF